MAQITEDEVLHCNGASVASDKGYAHWGNHAPCRDHFWPVPGLPDLFCRHSCGNFRLEVCRDKAVRELCSKILEHACHFCQRHW